ncbi:MAG: tyrosine recombinase XerC [Clostridia bacterium]|nr:tyrosine recombinase XerC [Clostridia bacterium]
MSTEYDPKEYSPILRDFASYKATISGCSHQTVNEYMRDIRAFFQFVIADRSGTDPASEESKKIKVDKIDFDFLRSIEVSDIYNYLFFCERELGNKVNVRARKLCAIRALFKYYCKTRMMIDNNPAEKVESPKKQKSLPRYMSYEEAVYFIETVHNDTSQTDFIRIRNWCIVTLFLNCGMRLSELVGISLNDVDRFLRSVRILGKGNKERILYFNDACRAALEEYIPLREEQKVATENENALFLSRLGKRIDVRMVQKMVDKYLEASGLGNRGLSVHKLRHTAATLMYSKGGVDVRVLKEILGHEQLNTTQIYTHVSNSEVEAAMAKNPLAGLAPTEPKKDEKEETVHIGTLDNVKKSN